VTTTSWCSNTRRRTREVFEHWTNISLCPGVAQGRGDRRRPRGTSRITHPVKSCLGDRHRRRRPLGRQVHVTRLEDAVIATFVTSTRGPTWTGRRLDGYPGVWADVDAFRQDRAVGVRTERNDLGLRRTLHGVALNVDIDMEGFKAIVPCGIADKPSPR